MEEKILKKIEEQGEKLDKIYASVEKTRKYFLSVVIIAIVMIVFPLVGLIFMIPRLIGFYTDMLIF